MGDTDKTIMQIAAERAGLKVIGPEATDDDVQNAVDDADGKHDGDIVNEPENDVDAILHAHLGHGLSDAEAIYSLLKVVLAQKGTNEGDAAAWGRVALHFGPDLINAIKKLASLFA